MKCEPCKFKENELSSDPRSKIEEVSAMSTTQSTLSGELPLAPVTQDTLGRSKQKLKAGKRSDVAGEHSVV